MKKVFSLSILALSLMLSACDPENDDNLGVEPVIEFSPFFSPSIGLIPFPNDLYFAGTTDGTLNIPSALSIIGSDAMNALDGFSTNAGIKVNMNQAIDPATLVGGSTAHLFEVTTDPLTKAVNGFVGVLAAGTDYTVGTSSALNGATTVEFTPLKPLNPKSSYLMALTSGINSATGTAAAASATYQSIKDALATNATLPDATLDQIKLLVGAHLVVLGGAGVSPDNVLVTASFSTQSTTDVLEAAAAVAMPQDSSIAQVFAAPGIPLSTDLISSALPGYSNVYTGTVATPLITIPNATSPWVMGFVAEFGVTPEQAGYQWPLVIFQHGITGNRTNAFGIVDAYAAAGYAVISIDQPLHGITDTENLFYQAGNERTFDLDLNGDGEIEPSGTYTINLQNLLVGRDNNRQASLDLAYLAKTAPTIDINGDATPDFDGSRMHFIGQSLGSNVGTAFLAVSDDVITGTLSVPGGGIADLLRNSPSFGPSIEAGLVALGLTPDTILYDDFFRSAQTVIDSADPLSYAALAAENHPILLQKVTGDNVIPNESTDRLIAAMGLPAAARLGANPGPLGAVTFIQGGHGSLLVPQPSLATTVEMQTQAVVFAGAPGLPGDGAVILIQDADVVEIATQ